MIGSDLRWGSLDFWTWCIKGMGDGVGKGKVLKF